MAAQLLTIEVSPRYSQSISRILTDRFVDAWRVANPAGVVVVRDLVTTSLPFVDMPWIGGAFAPPESHTPESEAAIKVSDDLVEELRAADCVVIGTPMYNLHIPASLKAYIDHIVRVGVTVSQNYEGLLTGKKTAIILAAGGNYEPGTPFENMNFAIPYLRHILALIGMTDVEFLSASLTRAVDEGNVDRTSYVNGFDAAIAKTLAAWEVEHRAGSVEASYAEPAAQSSTR